MQNSTNPDEILFNTTANVIGANSTQIRIDMQFDYTSTFLISHYL
jgi:hypothetical protein